MCFSFCLTHFNLFIYLIIMAIVWKREKVLTQELSRLFAVAGSMCVSLTFFVCLQRADCLRMRRRNFFYALIEKQLREGESTLSWNEKLLNFLLNSKKIHFALPNKKNSPLALLIATFVHRLKMKFLVVFLCAHLLPPDRRLKIK